MEMFPNLKRTMLQSHIYADQEIPLLKQTAIYGANGAGKSNFVKALGFIREFVTRMEFLNGEVVSEYCHKLTEDGDNKPICILVEFLMKGNYYIYDTEISSKGVDKEALYLSGIGKKKNEIIFRRIGEAIELSTTPSKEVQHAISRLLSNNRFSSIMSLNEIFPVINDRRVDDAFEWFLSKLDIVTTRTTLPELIHFMDSDQALMEFTKDTFSKIGLGINDVHVRTEEYEDWVGKNAAKIHKGTRRLAGIGRGLTTLRGDKPLFFTAIEDGIKKVKELVFDQLGKDGCVTEMGIESQSDGTFRLLMIIPAIYEAVNLGHTVIVDEIENSVHPILIRALVSFFAKADTTGQLIFTTHETCLLNQSIMRPDEVWFAEKVDGATRMYSLNDFKVHHTISIENGYLEGRYGAIPFIGEL